MLHKDRVHTLRDVESADDMADRLTKFDHVGCAGYRHDGVLYLHDGSGEWAVFAPVPGGHVDIESITFGWCDRIEALRHILAMTEKARTADLASLEIQTLKLDTGPHRCGLCA